jgi:hypothetical protein
MLADAAYVRAVGNLPDDVPAASLSPHLDGASLRLRRWVGEAAYSDADSPSPADPARALALKLAEAHLAVSVLYGSLAGQYKDQSGFVGGASLAQGSASYLTPTQIGVLQKHHQDQAETHARPYIIAASAAGVVVDMEA